MVEDFDRVRFKNPIIMLNRKSQWRVIAFNLRARAATVQRDVEEYVRERLAHVRQVSPGASRRYHDAALAQYLRVWDLHSPNAKPSKLAKIAYRSDAAAAKATASGDLSRKKTLEPASLSRRVRRQLDEAQELIDNGHDLLF